MTAEAMKNFSLSDAVVTSVIGFAIVFFVLIILMFMIQAMRGVVASMEANKAAAAPAADLSAPAAVSNSNMVPAKGSVGDVKLHNVPDRTAAMLMAIVADKLEAPLNTLRFISIREKK